MNGFSYASFDEKPYIEHFHSMYGFEYFYTLLIVSITDYIEVPIL